MAPGSHVAGRPASQGSRGGGTPTLRNNCQCGKPDHYSNSVPDEGFRRSQPEREHYHLLVSHRVLGICHHFGVIPLNVMDLRAALTLLPLSPLKG